MNKPGSTRKLLLTGKRVYLRSFDAGEISSEYLGWLNDPEITKYLEVSRFPSTRATVKKYLQRFENSDSSFILAIYDRKTDKHIGTVTLSAIDSVHRHANTGIMIGAKKYWRKGYGYEAWGLLLDYGFTQLGLHKIIAGAVAENVASLNLQKKLGFKIDGTFREEHFIDGKYRDSYRTSLFAQDLCFRS